MNSKKWYQSQTIQVAVVQGLLSILVALFGEYPELQGAGALMFLKSFLDLLLRMRTNTAIK
jgi:hypothetical protein